MSPLSASMRAFIASKSYCCIFYLTFLREFVYTIDMINPNIERPKFDWAALPHTKFDITSKNVFRAFPQEIARYFMNEPTLEFIELIESELPLVETREMDILMKVEIHGRLTLVHFEIQTGESTHRRMVRRTVGYIGRGYEEHGLPIRSHVIYLRPGAGRNDPGVYTQSDLGYRIHIEYQVIRLFELDGQPVLDSGNVGLIPFAPLMRPPVNLDGIEWVQHCIEATRHLPLDPLSQPDYLTSLGILSGLAHDPEAVFNLVSEESMMESGVYRRLWERATADAKIEADKFVEESLNAALQRGIQQGAREIAIEGILDVLDVRFESAMVQLFKPQLEQIDDLEYLRQLRREAVGTPSLEAFTETLMQNGNG